LDTSTPDAISKDDSVLTSTPPSAKKQKKAPVKKTAGKPLAPVENDVSALDGIDDDGATTLAPARPQKDASDRYQKVFMCPNKIDSRLIVISSSAHTT
jgi:DNA topoisomerase II